MKVELFDRYVHAVGRRLPRKQRADVKAELHSLLMDALQDRMVERGAEGGAASEADQVTILEEFGPPAQVAAQYTPPHRYLIGPPVLDIYLIVAAVAAGARTLAHLILLIVIVWGEAEPLSALISAFGETLGDYLGSMLAGFGSITLTFAILERVLPESVFEEEDEEMWDPRTLPEIQDRTRIEVRQLIVGTGLTVIALIVFNFFPGWIGIGFAGSVDGSSTGWHMIPILSPAFFTEYLPLINVAWVLTIGLNVLLLRQGRWQRLTRLADFLLTIFGAFILLRMVSGPSPILSMSDIALESLGEVFDFILSGLLKVGLIVGLIVTIGEAIHKLYLVFQGHSQTAPDLLDKSVAH